MSWLTRQPTTAREHLRAQLTDPDAAEVRRYSGADEDFGCWLLACDQHCRRNHGISIFDLPDIAWRDHHDSHLGPVEAVRAAVAAA